MQEDRETSVEIEDTFAEMFPEGLTSTSGR